MPVAKGSAKVQSIKKSESYESGFLDAHPDPICVLGSKHEIVYSNFAFDRFFGKNKIKNFEELFTSGRQGISESLFEQAGYYEEREILTATGRQWVDLRIFETPRGWGIQVRPLGEKLEIQKNLVDHHASLQTAYQEMERLNIELQATQDALAQAGKLAALGELAAGIAHEINQPLMGIRGYCQELQEILRPLTQDRTEKGVVEGALKEVISNIDKITQIIKSLRTYVRQSTDELVETSIHAVIDEALKLLSHQLRQKNITVEKHFESQDLRVMGTPIEFERVFINLLTNARDAIGEAQQAHGKIEISTKDTGPFVEILFSDNGPGMTAEVMDKAFNPFFTTKEVGKGMGLGLSLSYGVLNKVHGTITVESALGSGTRFVIRIPKDFRKLNKGKGK